MQQTPSSLGWRMPAEWEPHQGTWLAWPHNRSDWPGKFGPIPWVYADIILHLTRCEFVHLLVDSPAHKKQVLRVLKKCGIPRDKVRLFSMATNRVWTRDYGPTFVRSPTGQLGMIDWAFNAWAKYDDWESDNRIPSLIQSRLELPIWQPMHDQWHIVMEGGSIDVNGQGLLLTTEECLLDTVQQRNPCMSRSDIESALRDYLGVKKILWLHRGIVGDDTHGHVDDLARFVNENTVVTVTEEDPDDANYELLQENLHRLQNMTNLAGQPLDIVTLPMPAPVVFQEQRLPASYANFYIANDCVLVPTFNDPKDRIALDILATQFPNREVIGIHALDLVWGLGTLHCMTQQQPKTSC